MIIMGIVWANKQATRHATIICSRKGLDFTGKTGKILN